ncbi:carbon-monoxide dehydrogenase medium subunit [Roseovarius marisflavi]|uniref:Carbon-monoxide dehydrogenase medium subunit n=1 Tax=Roseovarius marisflavi TaxID=1054996 RepID=A0A1M6VAU3_9RHOB|nr:xanthine dehydrogenase family protein subunit M [Roseovarius marisflavi]SHK78569.1 carbon-monoxide dehydrogenase medium subunit [Roseovarius marisflavi]
MRYEAPNSVEAAIDLLAATEGAYVLAGGTDLLVKLRAEMLEPELVVDIKRISGMKGITPEDGGWRIGAAVSGAEMGEHAGLTGDWPGVVEAVGLIGSTQVQGRATLAGNLCNASPAADSVPAMVAANATLRIVGPKGSRDVAVIDVPASPGKTTLGSGEFIASVFLPAKPDHGGDAYLRFIPRTEMDIAVVGCGVSLVLDGAGKVSAARVSLGAVGPKVMLVDAAAEALIGRAPKGDALEDLAAVCSAAATPIDDKRGTVDFRRHVAGVLARRATEIAATRAKGETA